MNPKLGITPQCSISLLHIANTYSMTTKTKSAQFVSHCIVRAGTAHLPSEVHAMAMHETSWLHHFSLFQLLQSAVCDGARLSLTNMDMHCAHHSPRIDFTLYKSFYFACKQTARQGILCICKLWAWPGRRNVCHFIHCQPSYIAIP